MKIREHVLISQLTTMRLGAAARYLIEIENEDDLGPAYDFVSAHNLPSYILGDGSNVIGRDEAYEGVVLHNLLTGIEIKSQTADELLVRVATGTSLNALVDYAVNDDWYGIEALAAVPGTVGGAVMQNAGAYGQEMSQVLVGVDAYDINAGEYVHIPVDDMNLCYRHSIFNSAGPDSARGRYFITAAHIRLNRSEIAGELYGSLHEYLVAHGKSDRRAATIRAAVRDIRDNKLPDPRTTPSAGSFFKNITVDEADIPALRQRFEGIPIFLIGSRWEIPSGWLIEQAGLKGALLHGMRVSDKAALILINESAGSYANLSRARAQIATAVKEKFGFDLQQEPEEIT
ncbi:MAG: UDP-N-acetylmuramate dehydrogenase [Coriobacteriia bacterium]|nr:UDP-N-acetylmuramate dehydrogenase [Coriobacteriia bacterium]MCL2536795.1 UDP-N-acetylmuramate dehydrogenase [Coriobacteriia bacterium]